MARPVRMDFPETFYHALSRGNEKREIFREEKDYRHFVDLLGQMAKRFEIEIHAYVLMKNHYHLLLRTKKSNLSRALQWLGVSYSVWFNRRYQRTGHLFQGRFKSFLIENEKYFTAMCLYLHGNPYRAGIVKDLLDFEWSSFRSYQNRREQPSWLVTDLVLGIYGANRRRFARDQQAFLEGEQKILADLRQGLYLGSEDYAEECLRRAKEEKHQEKPQVRMLMGEKDIQTLANKVLEQLGEKNHQLIFQVRKKNCPNRDIAIYILYQLGAYRNADIGRVFGVGYTTITGAVKRGKEYLHTNPGIKRRVERILNDI